MMFELAAYGKAAGLLRKLLGQFKLNRIAEIYLSLIGAMIIGRLVYMGVLLFSGLIKLDKAPAAITVFTSFLAGIPDIIQLIVIPPVIIATNRLLADSFPAGGQKVCQKVILLCGKIVSGKSTYAQVLPRENDAVILSGDELSQPCMITALRRHVETVAHCSQHLNRLALHIIASGADMILDSEYWSKANRETVRAFLFFMVFPLPVLCLL